MWCLSLQDICTEAAVKIDISPVALDFFTLVTEDGRGFLNPNKVLSESECSQVYFFKLCIKACHGIELKNFDKKAFEYYFHQVCLQNYIKHKGPCLSTSPNIEKRVEYTILGFVIL